MVVDFQAPRVSRVHLGTEEIALIWKRLQTALTLESREIRQFPWWGRPMSLGTLLDLSVILGLVPTELRIVTNHFKGQFSTRPGRNVPPRTGAALVGDFSDLPMPGSGTCARAAKNLVAKSSESQNVVADRRRGAVRPHNPRTRVHPGKSQVPGVA